MNTPTYRIQVNIKDGGPEQWRTMKTVYGDEKSVRDDCANVRVGWRDILEFRIIKIEVVE